MNTYSEKYSDEQLKGMAIVVLKHLDVQHNSGLELVMTIAMTMGMHPQQVVNRIKELANLDVEAEIP